MQRRVQEGCSSDAMVMVGGGNPNGGYSAHIACMNHCVRDDANP